MTSPLVSHVSTQVVIKQTAATKIAVASLFAQMVNDTEPYRAIVSSLTTQVVERNEVKRFFLGEFSTQVVIQNPSDTGGVFDVLSQFPQVVYTTGANDQPRQRAWTFDFDGHVFYCLDMGPSGCLVFDTLTGSWSRWNTAGYSGHFNFKNGFHWRAGKQVLGGGIFDGAILHLDEDQKLDEDFKPIAYEIQGVLFTSDESIMRQYNLRMVGSPGRTNLVDEFSPPVLRMVYSDDNGATWSPERTVTLSSTDKDQRIEFRSLGRMKQPGRIFRLYDDGGIKFIAYVMADVEGE